MNYRLGGKRGVGFLYVFVAEEIEKDGELFDKSENEGFFASGKVKLRFQIGIRGCF